MASIHDKLKNIRKPRVHISYEVETEGATIQKELPFVVGVMGDFSGDPTTPLKPLKERRFVQIDRDNFDQVLASLTPGLNLRVANTLKDDGSEFHVELAFHSMEDFEPAAVVAQVEPLRKLLEARTQLNNLLTYMDGKSGAEALLAEVLKDPTLLKSLANAPLPARREPSADESAEEI